MFSEKQRSKSHAAKCECHKPGSPDCADMGEKLRAEYRRLDIEDVTDSVMKVMRICGLKPWEVKAAADVIRRSFMYFEEIMRKIDRVPRKRFGKESFLHGLAHVAQMSRIDAQMAFAIVKRAFKAFYYGTGVEGRRYACLQARLQHGEECMWLHAAHRTAEIHAVLAGLMDSEKRLFEERIECVYKDLVDVLRTRVLWENDTVCSCGQPSASPSRTHGDKAVSQAESLYSAEIELIYHQEMKGPSSAPSMSAARTPVANQSKAVSSASSRHNYGLKKGNHTPSNKPTPRKPSVTSLFEPPQCNCPKLRCWQENGEARESPEITAECSQGPYICRWLPFDGEEDEGTEHRVPYPPMEDICPPCPAKDWPCDPVCTCTCEVCTCQPAFDGDFEEEHLGERLSKSGVEDHDTDFCWVGPFRGSSRERMARQRAREELLKAECELEEEEEEDFQCRCTCEVKQRAFPHLFTYLTDFKDKQPVQEEPQPEPEPKLEETESEDLLSKPPPYGISEATYRCWVKPKSSESESRESTEAKKQPPLVWVMADKPKPKPDIQITIKKQHGGNSQVASAPAAAPLPKAPVLPNKPTPPPAPGKPPLAPQKQQENDEKLTKEDILEIIGMRFKQKK